jgi:hypothetical protein
MELTIVELMVTSNINNMRKLEGTPLEKVTEPCYSLLLASKISKGTVAVRIEVEVWMVVQILSDHNVAA